MLELALSGLVALVIAIAISVMLLRKSAHAKRSAEQLKLALAEGQVVPVSLHPVIDAQLCVGSFSCIKACPEGEIIGIVDGVATLVEAGHCIGHGTCAVECPVGAIKLVYGTAERGVDLPETDDTFESTRAGVYVIGELGGMGLIKNALRQGLLLGKSLKGKLKKSEAQAGAVDVVVVGGGPAGIACALSCKVEGLVARVLEQDSIGGTIAHYPRGKVVMTEQIVMPNYGPFGRSLLSKEELITEFHKVVQRNQLKVEEGQKVVKIDGDAPHFVVHTQKGTQIKTRAVVLAIGLRGSPMKLGSPGEDLPKVVYRLVEPEQYHGQRVLVVGGGDSAVEAAIQLAEESTAKVSISYRQLSFAKAKKRNRDKIDRLINEGRVRALLGTRVLSIEPGVVRIGAADADGAAAPKAEVPKGETRPNPPAPPASPAAAMATPKSTRLGAGEVSSKLPSIPLGATTVIPEGAELARSSKLSSKEDSKVQKKGEGFGKDDEKSAVTGRWRAKALDSEPAPAAPADPKAAPVINRSSAGPENSKRAPSALSALKASVKVIVGGRARSIEDLEDSSMMDRPPEKGAEKGGDKANASTDGDRNDRNEKSEKSEKSEKRAGEGKLKNDTVIVCIGGQLPTAFLKDNGVNTRKYTGQEKSGTFGAPGKQLTKAQVEARSRRRLALTLFAIGGAILVGLVLIGQEYYWLPIEERSQSLLHPFLKPSGLWGHGVGVGATTFMLANFVYALRKRWSKLKGTAPIRTWLTFHMFVGIMSPLVIAFHAAFLVNNLLAVWTWLALAVVVGTGVFGRFLFSFVPAQAGKVLQVGELREQVNDVGAMLAPRMADATNYVHVTQLFQAANQAPEGRTLIAAVLQERKERVKLVKEIDAAKTMFKDVKDFDVYKEGLQRVRQARIQIAFYAALKRIFRAWLIVHVVIAIFMVGLIGAHVAVTTYLGFTWIFSDKM